MSDIFWGDTASMPWEGQLSRLTSTEEEGVVLMVEGPPQWVNVPGVGHLAVESTEVRACLCKGDHLARTLWLAEGYVVCYCPEQLLFLTARQLEARAGDGQG